MSDVEKNGMVGEDVLLLSFFGPFVEKKTLVF